MKRFAYIAAFLLLGFGFTAQTTAQAQTIVKVGPRIGIPVGDVSDFGGDLFIGGDVRFITEALPVVPNVSYDYYMGFDESLYAIDLNGLYEFGVNNASFTPYAGGGLGITGSSNDTELGFNLAGGVRFLIDPIEPFVQVNTTFGSDLTRTGVAGGILFSF